MEAIFGVLWSDPSHRIERDAMARVARLLGAPDATIEIDGSFALGISRHVLDRDTQAPGIARSADDSLWVAVTGELESHRDLQVVVANLGLDPGDGTDAELLLALYRHAGADCARRVQGYFNAVVWSRAERRLVLIADRCGSVKGLYHWSDPDRFAFGSSARAVLAQDGAPRELDRESLEDVLVVGHPIAPRTMFRGVHKLAAGTCLERTDARVEVTRTWQRSPWHETRESLENLGSAYFAALERAVARSVRTDAPVGIMLSGGVDSAALVSLLRRLGAPRIRTFSVHLDDADRADPDRLAAQEVARRFGTEHRALEDLDARCLDLLPEMLWHFECPAQEIHPTWWLARRMREECEVVVAGHGNDLVWGCWTPSWKAGRWARALVPGLTAAHYLRIRRKLDRADLRRMLPASPRTDLALLRRIAPYSNRTGDPLTDFVCLDEGVFGDQLVFREVGKSIVDAHGLWPRMPYTDSAVVRIAESVPPPARLRRLGPGATEFKSFFKELMLRHEVLPHELTYRPKSWMSSPTARWLREELHPVLAGVLLGRRARARGLFDPRRVAALVDEHRGALADHTYLLGMLLAVEVWHRLFVDPPAIAKPDWTLAQCVEP